jgi:hypothetical protein
VSPIADQVWVEWVLLARRLANSTGTLRVQLNLGVAWIVAAIPAASSALCRLRRHSATEAVHDNKIRLHAPIKLPPIEC